MTFGAEFLSFPDLFPARDSGERWGDHELTLSFAGGPYHFQGLSATQLALLNRRFAELHVPSNDDQDRVGVQIFEAPSKDFRELEPAVGRLVSVDLDYQPDVVRLAGRRLMGRLSLAPLEAALWTSVEEPLEEVIGVFENLFRILVAYRLNELGGVLLHSAAVVRDGRAFLFLGRSGAGKSTISKINHEAGLEVLSDDMNALVLQNDCLTVEKLPFAGEFGQTARRRGGAPLAGLYRLKPATEHSLQPLPEPEALALLLSCAPFLNADPFRTDRLMQNLTHLARGCATGRLSFRRDGGFWDLIEQAS